MTQTEEKRDLQGFIDDARKEGLSDEDISTFVAKNQDAFDWGAPTQAAPAKTQVYRPGSIQDAMGIVHAADEQKRKQEEERVTRSIQNSKAISSFAQEMNLIKDQPTKYEVYKFLQDSVGAKVEDLGAAADSYLNEVNAKGPGLSKAPKDYTSEDYFVRGTSPPFGAGKVALTGAQLAFTAFAPEATLAYLALGSVSNLNNSFKGYAVAIPREDGEAIFKNPRDMDPTEFADYIKWQKDHPQKYYLAGNEMEAAQIMARVGGGYTKDDLAKLPQMDLSNVPVISANELSQDDKMIAVGTSRISKFYTSKSVGEVLQEAGKTVMTLGLASPTPGQALAIQTGTENSGVATIVDILVGAGLAYEPGGKAVEVPPEKPKPIGPRPGSPGKLAPEWESLDRTLRQNAAAKDIKPTISSELASKLPKSIKEVDSFANEVKAASGDVPPPIKFATQVNENIRNAAKQGALADPEKIDVGIGPISYYFGSPASRLGASTMEGPKAVQDFFVANVYRDYEVYNRNVFFKEQVFDKVPKQYRAAIPEIMMGRTMKEIVKEYPDLGEEGFAAIRTAKEGFEADRQFIIQNEKSYGKDLGEDFGHQDRYFPGVFKGQLEIIGKDGNRFGFAETKNQAKALIDQLVDQKEGSFEDFSIRYKANNANSWLRLTNEQQKSIVDSLAKSSGMEPGAVGAAFDELGLTKPGGQFFLKEKKFAPNYEKDARIAMDVYNRSFANYKFMRPIKSAVEAQITRWTDSGREWDARMLQRAWEGASGQPTTLSKWFDRQMFNVFGGRVAPRALERWTGGIKQGQGIYYVANPRFGLIVNPSQTFETLAPYGTLNEYRQAMGWMYSSEGKAAIAQFGHENPGSKFFSATEGTAKKVVKGASELFFWSEDVNQKAAWSYFYRRGLSKGLSPEEANKMGILRGMIGTQYLNLASDRPTFSSGPVSSFVYQFTRFKIKNFEQALDIIKMKDYPAAARYVASKLILGGAGAYIPTATYLKMRKHNQSLADWIYFGGLGNAIGADLTSSFNIGLDLGPGHFNDKVTRQILGVPGNMVYGVASAMLSPDKGLEATSALERGGKALIRKSPLGKELLELGDMFHENNEAYKTPDGRSLIQKDGTMTFKAILGLTDKRINIARQMVDNTMAIWDLRNEYRIKSFQYGASDLLNPDPKDYRFEDLREKTITQWNEMNPEFPIDEGKTYRTGFAKFLKERDPSNNLFDRYISRFSKKERGFLLDEIDAQGMQKEYGK